MDPIPPQLCRQWLQGNFAISLSAQTSKKGKEKKTTYTDDEDEVKRPSRQSKRKRSTESEGERSDAGEHKLILREPLGEYKST